MADNPIPLKPKKATPDDALDIESLWLDPALGDGLVDVHYHEIPVGKPKNFFRVNPDPAYRRLTEIYTHKVEGEIEEQNFIIAKPMRGRIDEARRCTLVTVIYRDGSPRLWPLKLPKRKRERQRSVVLSAFGGQACDGKVGQAGWQKRSDPTRDAQPGYAPDPDWSKLPSFDELIELAFGKHGIIGGEDHPIVQDLFGAAPKKRSDDDDGSS